MASRIQTRIKLRNDTLANWESSTVKIFKGEAALGYDAVSDKYEIRFGTDDVTGSTWSELAASNLTIPAANVVGLNNALYDYQLTAIAATAGNGLTGTGSFKIQKRLHSAAGTDAAWTDVNTVTLKFADKSSNAAGYSDSNPIALKAYVDEKTSAATNNTFIGVRSSASTSDSAAITAIVGDSVVKGGDVCIVKTLIVDAAQDADKKYSFKAFVYDTTTNSDSPVWQAMDGNYDWNNVYATEDLTVTQAVGTITIPSSGSTTFAVAGKSVKQVFEKLLAQEKCPTVTQPSASITLTNAGAKEVGTSITPAYSCTFSAGSYTYGPATGVTSKATTVYHDSTSDSDADTINAGSLNGATGTLDAITVTSSTNYKVKMSWGCTAGATPKTNLGNDATQENDSGSTVSATAEVTNDVKTSSGAITGYVMGMFYGTLTDVVAAANITSAQVRGLTNKSNNGTSTGTKTFTVPVGAKTIVIAAAGSRTLTQVLNTTVNADMTESFTKQTGVSVCGADAPETANANNYTVWTYSPAEAYASTASLTIKIS